MKSPLSKRLGSRISQSDSRSVSSIASNNGTSARISTGADINVSWKVLRREYVLNAVQVTEKNLATPAERPARWLRTGLVILREKHDVAVATLAVALRFQIRRLREREVKHAALARIHRRK